MIKYKEKNQLNEVDKYLLEILEEHNKKKHKTQISAVLFSFLI